MADVAPPPGDLTDPLKAAAHADYTEPTDTASDSVDKPLDLSTTGKPQKIVRKKKETKVTETTSTVYGFIRVKRRADEDPASKILVSFKRQRVVEKQDENVESTTEDYEHVEKVLSFAGSVESHDHETINSFLEQFDANNAMAPRSKKFQRNVKELRQLFTPASSLLQRRQEIQRHTNISRCKIVSAHRGIELEPEALIGSSGPKPLAKYSMYDLIHHAEEAEEITKVLPKSDEVITVNGMPMVPVGGDQTPAAEPKRASEGKGGGMTTYVYDLYALPTPIDTEDPVNVERRWDENDFVYDDDGEDDEQEHPYQDEEDSNAEDNPNNDYPEEPEDDDDERDVEEADKDYAAGYYDENDMSDEEANAAGWVNGSKGMKELAKHMNTLKLGHTGMDAIYYNDDEELDDDFDGDALKEVDDDDDYEEEDYDY